MKYIFVVLICLLVAACQPVVKAPDNASNLERQIKREVLLRTQDRWSFRGRVAVSDGNQAGNVKMFWQQRGDQFEIEISLPISNQKYRLHNVNNKVRLEGSGVASIEGDSAEAVLQQVAGWRIPFRQMQIWLRGMRYNSTTPIEFAPSGLPAQFRENGWLVDYRSWNAAATPMPTKVFASSSDNGNNGKSASVRLQIEAWEVLP